VAQQRASRVVDTDDAEVAVDGLIASELLHDDGAELSVTERGEALRAPILESVSAAAARLYGDLAPADLEVTRHILAVVTQRAGAQLAGR
jgi:hypothetical protein